MNFDKYVVSLLLVGILFLMYTLFLFILKEKSIKFIAGFNLKSDEEQKKYDVEAIVKDIRNKLFFTSAIFFIGAVATLFLGNNAFFISIIVGVVFVFKIVNFNPDKAYNKYLKNNI